MKSGNDWLTALCIGVIAACLVTADHEAFGHGSACLALGGHITLLTSSIFHCDARSDWIDPAGPLGNLLGGAIALILSRLVPRGLTGLRLFLIAVTAFSWFWEGGYVVQAMIKRDGDLYFFARFMLGDVTVWERALFAGLGIVLYVVTLRITSRSLLELWPNPAVARGMARLVWLGGTLAATFAGLVYRGAGWHNLHDAVLEIAGASLALLIIPIGRASTSSQQPATLSRSYVTAALAILVFAAFALTLGRGIGTVQ
jgi:hypothetical protein